MEEKEEYVAHNFVCTTGTINTVLHPNFYDHKKIVRDKEKSDNSMDIALLVSTMNCING